jgi:putative transposase
MGYHHDFETRIMSNYRHLTIRGGTYFFTAEAYRRQPLFIDDARVELLRNAFREVKAKRPFDVVVAVILPNHLYCLWNLPEGDADFSVRWHRIKTSFSRRLSPQKSVKTAQKPFGNRVFMNIVSAMNATFTTI